MLPEVARLHVLGGTVELGGPRRPERLPVPALVERLLRRDDDHDVGVRPGPRPSSSQIGSRSRCLPDGCQERCPAGAAGSRVIDPAAAVARAPSARPGRSRPGARRMKRPCTTMPTTLLGPGAAPRAHCSVTVGSIVLHEQSHALAPRGEGDPTPRMLGHLTWNPVVHMGWLSLGLVCLGGDRLGATPVNRRNFRHRRWGDALVSGAGPAVNLFLALVGAAMLSATQHSAGTGAAG